MGYITDQRNLHWIDPKYPKPILHKRFLTSRFGLDCDMRYFTKEFLFNPGPNWTVNLDDAQPLADVLVKHVKTGHIWRLNGEHEPWQGTTIYLGRWPD